MIEWGHTHIDTHTLGTAMATKLHCKYAQNDRSDREAKIAEAQAQRRRSSAGRQDGPSRLWAKQSHKVENYI